MKPSRPHRNLNRRELTQSTRMDGASPRLSSWVASSPHVGLGISLQEELALNLLFVVSPLISCSGWDGAADLAAPIPFHPSLNIGPSMWVYHSLGRFLWFSGQ